MSWRIDTLGTAPAFTVISYRGVEGDRIVTGLALVPRTRLARYPMIISYNGNDGALPLIDRADRTYPQEYLNAYASVLAENGFVVLIPYTASWYPDGATSMSIMRGGTQYDGWARMLENYRDGLSFARRSLPVDSALVSGYGISFGGEAALMHAALDARITRVVYSNPISRPSTVFASGDAALLATWQNAICNYETAIRERLIAPRAMIWENGIRDANGQSPDPLETVRAVQAVYQALGAGDRFQFVRHGGGHVTKPNDSALLNALLLR